MTCMSIYFEIKFKILASPGFWRRQKFNENVLVAFFGHAMSTYVMGTFSDYVSYFTALTLHSRPISYPMALVLVIQILRQLFEMEKILLLIVLSPLEALATVPPPITSGEFVEIRDDCSTADIFSHFQPLSPLITNCLHLRPPESTCVHLSYKKVAEEEKNGKVWSLAIAILKLFFTLFQTPKNSLDTKYPQTPPPGFGKRQHFFRIFFFGKLSLGLVC